MLLMPNDRAIEHFTHGGKKVRICQDDFPSSPREWSCLGKMVCFHRRHNLGDEHNLKSSDFPGWDSIEAYLRADEGATHILPIYLFDHSGLALSTTGFSCAWDSGQVGFIYATAATIEEIGTPLELVEDQLREEVDLYSKYISGEVYEYEIVTEKRCPTCDHVEEDVEVCGGFFSIEEAKECAKHAINP